MKSRYYHWIGGACWGAFVAINFPTDWSLLSLVKVAASLVLGPASMIYFASAQLADCKSEAESEGPSGPAAPGEG